MSEAGVSGGLADGGDSSKRSGCVFITWERHRRTRSLVTRLGLRLHEIVAVGSRPRRYVLQIRETLRLLAGEKPAVAFVQNPSLVLACVVLIWRNLAYRRARIIVDAHNEAIEPRTYRFLPILWLSRWVIRAADYTVVTNRFLAAKVDRAGGHPLVLPDPIPRAPAQRLAPSFVEGVLTVLVVATYARDEPIEQILNAARPLQGVVELRFTGEFKRLPGRLIASAPANVRFLGFLTDALYWEAMQDAHAVLDMTLLEDCLVCGAYEAVAAGRPQILSDTRATIEQFRKGAVFSSANAGSIGSALVKVRSEYSRLAEEVSELRVELDREWDVMAGALVHRLFDGALPALEPIAP